MKNTLKSAVMAKVSNVNQASVTILFVTELREIAGSQKPLQNSGVELFSWK